MIGRCPIRKLFYQESCNPLCKIVHENAQYNQPVLCITTVNALVGDGAASARKMKG